MTNDIFRIFRPEGSKEDRVQKRRGQLRQAQQTYRERKDKYARALENELAKTRASEANLLREVQHLRKTVQTLVGHVRKQGIELSDEVTDLGNAPRLLSETSESPSSPPEHPRRFHDQSIEAFTTNPPHSWLDGRTKDAGSKIGSAFLELATDRWPPEHHRNGPTDSKATHAKNSNPYLGASSKGVGPHHFNVRLGDLDPLVVGTEFVLTLERPCLGHLHGDPAKPDEPAGHALTASTRLLSISPLSAMESEAERGAMLHGAPAPMLDSLLTLSSELCSEHEVTPVQAWNYIRCQPHFGGLEVRSLQLLADKLRDAVKCHGFGAVVEQAAFERLVFDILLLERPF